MENLRETANRYLEKTLENPARAGTPYTIIDPQENKQYAVTGTVSDTHLSVDANGEAIQDRAIIVTCLIKRLPVHPQRGWEVHLKELNGEAKKYFIQEVQPDNTIGLYYFVLGHNFSEDSPE
ncbi:MAG: hypothetical protein FWC64_07115 [Treponema sp.]|nr:hypothetical protein [Treponema sp.]